MLFIELFLHFHANFCDLDLVLRSAIDLKAELLTLLFPEVWAGFLFVIWCRVFHPYIEDFFFTVVCLSFDDPHVVDRT